MYFIFTYVNESDKIRTKEYNLNTKWELKLAYL